MGNNLEPFPSTSARPRGQEQDGGAIVSQGDFKEWHCNFGSEDVRDLFFVSDPIQTIFLEKYFV